MAVAAAGAHAAAALLLYSPTKLARLPSRNGSAWLADLQKHEREYELLAWIWLLAGAAVAIPVAVRSALLLGGWPLAALTALAAVLLCAALPVALALRRAEVVVQRCMPVLRGLRLALHYPIVLPLAACNRAALRALRVGDEPRDPEAIAEEIMAAVTDSAQESALADEERHWIENIIELKDLHVSEAMTPRTDVTALEADMPLRAAVQRAIDTGYSRYPVYEGKVDRVIGVFYAKDALARLGNGGNKDVRVRDVMRKPLFVPETMGVIELLREFKTSKLQMAIVLDEYGGTAGIISLEDILEEIVGEIADEFEAEEEEPIVATEDGRVAELLGRARVDEVNRALGCDIPEDEEYDTIAGYVFTRLGKIPKAGETVQVDGIEFLILTADDRRIDRLRITLPEPAARE